METAPRFTYTVYADCGVGEFLWRKESGSTVSGLVGGNLYSLMDENHVPEEMSKELFQDFCSWARFYMSHHNDWEENTRDIDWENFNQRGVDLAQRLKNELGSIADVQYVHAWDDPDCELPPVVLQIRGNGT